MEWPEVMGPTIAPTVTRVPPMLDSLPIVSEFAPFIQNLGILGKLKEPFTSNSYLFLLLSFQTPTPTFTPPPTPRN